MPSEFQRFTDLRERKGVHHGCLPTLEPAPRGSATLAGAVHSDMPIVQATHVGRRADRGVRRAGRPSDDRLEHAHERPAPSWHDLDLIGELGHEEQPATVASEQLGRPGRLDGRQVKTTAAIGDLDDEGPVDAADRDVEVGSVAAAPTGVVAGLLRDEGEIIAQLSRDAVLLEEPAKVVTKRLEGLHAMQLPVNL